MHTRYFQAGGLAEDIPEGFYEQAREWCRKMPKAIDEYEAILDRNAIWLKRTKGIGLLSADDAIALGQSGPVLRASGVDWDLRKNMPYLAYDEVSFDVPVYAEGDVYARYKRAHGRDARVGADRLPVPRPARRRCAASRGSPTTARSCCRRARSSTPRWSR